ncbi:MAG: hypothetical protein D6722_02710 [Bacteroidetes bacterium]|nr:MAG: hypothetical protein D6722_02710 [Bacteroidota bacterium]
MKSRFTAWNRLRQAWHQRGLQHALFWLGYTGFWYILFMVVQRNQPQWVDLLINLGYLSAHMGVTYLNLYWLIPAFLARKHYLGYGLLFALLQLTGTLYLGGLLTTLFKLLSGEPWLALWWQVVDTAFWSVFTTLILTMAIKLYRQWRQSQRRNQELETLHLQTELQFLKAQLNPHFLFNAINSIYFLIHQDQDQAAEALARFSDILRYQLYECHEDLIPLEREVEQLKHFAALSQLRRGDQLAVDLDFPPDTGGACIPPFLLIPLLENAFKHVSAPPGQPAWIRGRLHRAPEGWHLELSNSVGEWAAAPEGAGGIGLSNIQRRLALLYPGEERLHLHTEVDRFSVHLRLPLSTGHPSSPRPTPPHETPLPDRR